MMIDYKLLDYLSEQEIKRDMGREIKSCYVTSDLILKYEKYCGRYAGGTFEYLLLNELPPQSNVHIYQEKIGKNLIRYKITMPVETMPYFMEAIRKIHFEKYPMIRVTSETIVRGYYWDIHGGTEG